jgi:hypothetical protein
MAHHLTPGKWAEIAIVIIDESPCQREVEPIRIRAAPGVVGGVVEGVAESGGVAEVANRVARDEASDLRVVVAVAIVV